MTARRPRPLTRSLLALLCVVLVVVLGGCSLSDLQGTNGKQFALGDGQVLQIAPDKRGAPVVAAGKDLDGNPLDVADYRGKVVMLNVWASWCTPCRRETPTVVALDQTFQTGADAGKVQVLGINIRQTGGTATANAFAQQNAMTYPSFDNYSGSLLLGLSDKLGGPSSLPSTVVLDQQGRLAALVIGEIPSQTTMREVVEQVVAGD